LVTTAVQRTAAGLSLTVRAKDELSLLTGMEYVFNNGHRGTVEHPADGILDGREETFIVEIGTQQAVGATSVEVIVYDAAGNSAARRLVLP